MTLKKKVYHILDAILICGRVAPIETGLMILNVIIHSALPYFLVRCSTKFINAVLNYYKEQDNLQSIINTIVQLSIVFFLMFFYSVIIRMLSERIAIQLRNKVNLEIIDKCSRLKYEYIETGETCDLINRILRYPGLDVIQNAFLHIMSGVEIIVNILIVGLLLLKQVWWAIPVILISILPLLITSYYSSVEAYKVLRWNTEIARKSNYIEFDILRGRDLAMERNLFGYAKHFNNKFEEFFRKTMKMEKEVRVKWFIRMKLSSILVTGVIISVALVLCGSLKAGAITMGFFISVVESLFRLENLLVNQVQNLISELVQDNEYFKDLTEFAALSEDDSEGTYCPEQEGIHTIEFKNVYFKYPGTSNYILKGLSFRMEEGKHYAIVGKNGSGKTTITKLLLRLYTIDQGEILINGKNIYDYSIEKVHSLFSVVYQDFTRYAITVKDNVGIGDLKNIEDMKRIKEVTESVGLKDVIDSLPQGYETPLGKVLQEGVDLSGGQWQRVALARTLMKRNTVKILDEPTAALDPIQESNLYKNYGNIVKHATTIFISHRLGSTKLADKIILIDDGKVLSCGSHEQLMKENGLYKEMFCMQKEWYDEA
ncbi:MAG: ABC transporter ATP-binding protein [Clostridiales bacterium]|nr:ABC transporter ATP-binding protein [Clostridiales bacterium]